MENLFIMKNTQTEKPILERRSMWIGLVFTLIFGPFGLMYCSVTWGIVMLIVTAAVAYFTSGIGLLILWPVFLILTYFLIARHNNKVQSLNQINYMD